MLIKQNKETFFIVNIANIWIFNSIFACKKQRNV